MYSEINAAIMILLGSIYVSHRVGLVTGVFLIVLITLENKLN